MPKVEVLRHPSGAAVVPVHYSMDPEKDREWAITAKAAAASDADWAKEHEIDFRSVAGEPVYDSFSKVANTRTANDPDCPLYSKHLPIRLCCDFNVDPMAWLISQVNNNKVLVIDEIFQKPGTVISACTEFIRRYGDHEEEIWLYGDASGRARSQKDQGSNYREIELQFLDKFNLKMRVPVANPSVVNRVRALNRRLRDTQGQAHMLINADRCPEFVTDLEQVVWAKEGKGKTIHEVRNAKDSYFYRGHISAAAGYFVSWEFPAFAELTKARAESDERQGRKSKPKPPPPKGKKRHRLGRFR